MPANKPNRTRQRKMRGKFAGYRAPVAFVRNEDDVHSLVGNPNTAKRRHHVLDRDSATAKRDGVPTQGAKMARQAPLGNRGQRHGNERIPSLPLTTRKDGS